MPYPSAKKSTLPVGKALLIAKQRLPGWAWCVLNNETFHLPTGGLVKKSACSLVDVMKVFSFAKVQAIRGKPVGMGAAPSYAEAIIRKVNDRSLRPSPSHPDGLLSSTRASHYPPKLDGFSKTYISR